MKLLCRQGLALKPLTTRNASSIASCSPGLRPSLRSRDASSCVTRSRTSGFSSFAAAFRGEAGAVRSGPVPRAFRQTMRRLPHPVVVITTLDRTFIAQQRQGIQPEAMEPPLPRVMTVSSFTSLTVDPTPRVSFNVQLPSKTYEAIKGCGAFNVHIMRANPLGARIADLFAQGNRPGRDPRLSTLKDATPVGLGVISSILKPLSKMGISFRGGPRWVFEFKQERNRWIANTRPAEQDKPGNGENQASVPLNDIGLDSPLLTVPHFQGQGISHVLRCRHDLSLDRQIDSNVIVVGEIVGVTDDPFFDGDTKGREGAVTLAYANGEYMRVKGVVDIGTAKKQIIRKIYTSGEATPPSSASTSKTESP